MLSNTVLLFCITNTHMPLSTPLQTVETVRNLVFSFQHQWTRFLIAALIFMALVTKTMNDEPICMWLIHLICRAFIELISHVWLNYLPPVYVPFMKLSCWLYMFNISIYTAFLHTPIFFVLSYSMFLFSWVSIGVCSHLLYELFSDILFSWQYVPGLEYSLVAVSVLDQNQ